MYQGLSQELKAVMVEAKRTGLFSLTCSINKPDGNLTASGAPSGTFTNVVGLQAIRCVAAPPSTARIQATEVKQLEEIMSMGLRHILMDGYYPTIQAGWQCVLQLSNFAAVNYEILGAEADSQLQMTRIEVRLATI